ncbi:MAG: hypothetical protein CMJ94_04420 [Planctomycetes bacterium]|nr:hypothetical protein [Planctomycetota bacterium]
MLILSSLLLAAVPQSALASTTSDTQLSVDPVCHDEALLLRTVGTPGSSLYWPRAAWFAQLRDLTGDGQLDLLPGVDALTLAPRRGATRFTPADLAFSTDANYAGFLDGDLLRFTPGGGLQCILPEDELVTALAVTSGNFDLDAAHIEGDVLFFSLKDGVQSAILGPIEDGDLLVYQRKQGAVSRLWTESDVQAMVDQAQPGSGSIGDLRSISADPITQELCFTVQSPTSDDATLYGDAGGGRLVPGFAEADYGFQVSTELDAFTFLPQAQERGPVLDVDLPYAASGETIRLKVRHGSPDGLVRGIICRKRGFAEADYGGGGAIFLDQQDALYQRQFQNGWMHPTQLDGGGSATFDWTAPVLPPQFDHVDHYFQLVDAGSGALSNPILVRLR